MIMYQKAWYYICWTIAEIIPQLLRQQKKTIQTSPSTESSKQRDNLIYSVKCEGHAVWRFWEMFWDGFAKELICIK